MIKNQFFIAILFFFTLNASASQIYYNPQTGQYEEQNEIITTSRNNSRQDLFSNDQQTIKKNKPKRYLFRWILPYISVYTGISGHKTPIDSIKYTMSDINIKLNEQIQKIEEQSFLGSNLFIGSELMIPITHRTKFGIGGSYNITKSAFNQTLSLTAKMPINTFFSSSIYGKFSFAMTQRLSLYILGGMQNINIEVYDYIKQSDGNPWYNKAMPVDASYNLLGIATKNAPFFGFGTLYKMSPSTSFFIDATYVPISNLTNIQKSDIASNGSYDAQINLITQNKQYYISQLRFGITFDFVGLYTDKIL